MAYTVQNTGAVGGTSMVHVAGQNLGPQAVANADTGDCVTMDPNSAAAILDATGATVATLVTGNASTSPTMQTFGPYAQTVYQVFYNGSYRWQINSPGNSTGIQI